MELKTVADHARARPLPRRRPGEPLVFLHGAGGVDAGSEFPEAPWRRTSTSTRPCSPATARARNAPSCATCSTSRCTPGTWSRRWARRSDPGRPLDGRHDRRARWPPSRRTTSRGWRSSPRPACGSTTIRFRTYFHAAAVRTAEVLVPRPRGRRESDRRQFDLRIRRFFRLSWFATRASSGAAGKILFPIPERGLAGGSIGFRPRRC